MGMGMGGAITAVAATTTAGIAVVIVAGGIITTGGIIIIGSDFTPQTIGLRPARGTDAPLRQIDSPRGDR
jgi:hypothetical protein